METAPASVGARIQAARRDRQMTQEALARACGVTRSAVAQWETGRAGQLGTHLGQVADALGVPVAQLLQGRDPRADAPAGLTGDELALLRLYRECGAEDRGFLLRTARRMARLGTA